MFPLHVIVFLLSFFTYIILQNCEYIHQLSFAVVSFSTRSGEKYLNNKIKLVNCAKLSVKSGKAIRPSYNFILTSNNAPFVE